MIYFSSDLHFFHNNVINLCSRPFITLDEMHKSFIEEWNNTVRPSDIIYYLGDFSLSNKAYSILPLLKGRKRLIIGNHDTNKIKNSPEWEYVTNYTEIKLNGEHLILFHYPIDRWNRMKYGSIHLHGHMHGTLNHPDNGGYFEKRPNRIDVGYDATGRVLSTLDQLMQD